MSRNKERLELRANLEIEYVDDPLLLEHLIQFVSLALEISDKSPEEADKIQKNFLDNY